MNTPLTPGARSFARRAYLPHRLAGGAAWAITLLGLAWLTSALLTLGTPLVALLVLALTVATSVLVPRALRRATRHREPLRAAADGASVVQRATLVGQTVAFGALAVAALSAGFEHDGQVGSYVTTFLAGAVALTLAGFAAAVVLPGAWLLPGRPWRPGRWIWLPLLAVGVALAYPVAPLVHTALLDAAAGAPALGWDLFDLIVLGFLSAAGTAAALRLFPRPWVAVDVDPQGERLVAARFGGAALVDVASARTALTLPEGRRVARFSPDGAVFALDAPDDEVVLRRAEDGAVLRRLDGAPREVRALAFSSDGAHLAAIGDGPWVALWDLGAATSGAPVAVTRVPTGLTFGRSLVFAADGRELVIAANAGSLVRVKLSDPKAGGRPTAGTVERPLTDSGLTRATLRPGGRLMAGAAGALGSPTRIMTLAPHGHQLTAGWSVELGDPIRALAFDPSGETLLSVTLLSDVRLFDARTGAPRDAREGLGGTVASVAATADLRRVALGGRWALRVWDRERGVVRMVDSDDAEGAAPAWVPAAEQTRPMTKDASPL